MTHVLVIGSANCSACSPPRLIDDRGLPATTWSAPTVQGHPCYVDLIVVESASVVLTAGTGAEPLYEYGPGSVIGELVLFTGHGVQFSAQARQPGVVHRVTPMSLRNLLLEERELAELLLTAFMAHRRRGRNDRGRRVTLEIVGTPQSPATQALRTYANRTGIKHIWLDADGPSGRSLMSAAGLVGADLPAVGPRETVINATPADLVTIRGHRAQGSST
jgi:hypothetical protein